MRGLELIGEQIRGTIVSELERVGLMFRLFWRVKTEDSVNSKAIKKNYSSGGKLMQDIIGIRIAVYFLDDASLAISILKSLFIIDNEEIDSSDEATFRPVRTNMVFKLPINNIGLFNSSIASIGDFIDSTSEIQVRTVLSEGWHEVEHDLRYKSKGDWSDNIDLSRALNGIYASLETSEWSMMKIFQEMSYRNYKEGKWNSMIRNKFRIRISSKEINPRLSTILNEKQDISKQIFRVDRNELMTHIISSKISVPMSSDNLIFMINYLFLNDQDINDIISDHMQEEMSTYLKKTNLI